MKIDTLPDSLKKNINLIGKSVISSYASPSMRVSNMLRFGQNIRDVQLWQMPILPGAVTIYQQLASTRDFTVTGKPRPAARAVEYLNMAQSIEPYTGMVYEGFEGFLKRRSLDYLSVGRTAMANIQVNNKAKLNYIDPTYLFFNPDARRNRRFNSPIQEDELVWTYFNDEYTRKQVIVDHPIPVGVTGLFVSPLSYVMPTAILSWLLREHDTASIDGRKIRDIILVGSDNLAEAIAEAVATQVSLWVGEDVSKVGIPIVSINNMSGVPVSEQITTIGLSRIPENFDREEFTFDYVNQIAASLSLSLRHFWNNERTTNKALEEVQEQRQQQKGPAEFVNNEQKLINRSGFLNQFGGRVTMSFIEEVDLQSQLTNAQVLKDTATAVSIIQRVFGASLSLDAMLRWMQQIRVLPTDLELAQTNTFSDTVIEEGQDDSRLPQNEEEVIDTSVPPTEKSIPDYDEVVLDSNHQLIEKRRKTFSIEKILEQEYVTEQQNNPPLDIPLTDFEADRNEYYQSVLDEFTRLRNADNIERFHMHQTIYSSAELEEAIQKIDSGNPDSSVYPIVSFYNQLNRTGHEKD